MKMKKSGLFLPEGQPLHCCREAGCQDCDLTENEIVCHFGVKRLLQFVSFMFPVFIYGGKIILEYSSFYLFCWIALIIAYFLFVEIRVMCSHCPHYGEPETKSLKCWANYGAPKLWRYRPGPMSFIETVVFLGCMATVVLSPLVFALIRFSVFDIIFYAILVVAAFTILFSFFCTKCMNFACYFNSVSGEVRKKFFRHNPEISVRWNDSDEPEE